MKNKIKVFPLAALCSLILSACPGPDPKPEFPGEILEGTWVAVGDNAIDGPNDVMEEDLADFTITITATEKQVNYITIGSEEYPEVFPASGIFNGITDNTNFKTGRMITRMPDQVSMTVTVSEDEETLTLLFIIDTQDTGTYSGNARMTGIDGQYTFVLDKQQ